MTNTCDWIQHNNRVRGKLLKKKKKKKPKKQKKKLPGKEGKDDLTWKKEERGNRLLVGYTRCRKAVEPHTGTLWGRGDREPGTCPQ